MVRKGQNILLRVNIGYVKIASKVKESLSQTQHSSGRT